jgi:hypothetical protein
MKVAVGQCADVGRALVNGRVLPEQVADDVTLACKHTSKYRVIMRHVACSAFCFISTAAKRKLPTRNKNSFAADRRFAALPVWSPTSNKLSTESQPFARIKQRRRKIVCSQLTADDSTSTSHVLMISLATLLIGGVLFFSGASQLIFNASKSATGTFRTRLRNYFAKTHALTREDM